MSTLLERLRNPSITNRPPTEADLRRNDTAVLLWVAFLLVLGFGIRNNALTAGNTVTIGDDLLQVTLPAGWVQRTQTNDVAGVPPNEYQVAVWNSRSPSLFDATIAIHARRLRPGENLASVRATQGLRRAQELPRYRELEAESVDVLNRVPGTRVTYAYIADPTRAAGALAPPVVVQAQDLIFIYRDHLIRVAVAADLADWEAESTAFARVFAGLNVRSRDPQSANSQETSP